MTNRLELNWNLDGFVDEQRYYCSETPIDPENLPVPKAVLASDVRTYIDTDIEIGKTYYVCVGSIKAGTEKLSSHVSVNTTNPWQQTVLLMHFNNNLIDSSLKNHAVIGSPIYKIGIFDNDIVINGAAEMVLQIDNAIDFSFAENQDFTIEFFASINSAVTGAYKSPLGNWSSNVGWCVFFTPSGLQFSFNNKYIAASRAISIGTFYYITVERYNNVISLYCDGMLLGSVTASEVCSVSKLYIGSNGIASDMHIGGIDELRITKYARYKGSVVRPTQPFLQNV